jgi:hypothetical protein
MILTIPKLGIIFENHHPHFICNVANAASSDTFVSHVYSTNIQEIVDSSAAAHLSFIKPCILFTTLSDIHILDL